MTDHTPLTDDELAAMERGAAEGYADPEDVSELIADLRAARAEVDRLRQWKATKTAKMLVEWADTHHDDERHELRAEVERLRAVILSDIAGEVDWPVPETDCQCATCGWAKTRGTHGR